MEEENKVSVWVGTASSPEEFEKYIAETYDDDGNMQSLFTTNFNIDYYDS